MSGKQVKKYKRAITRQVSKQRTLVQVETIERILAMPLHKRLRFALTVIRGNRRRQREI